MNKYDLNAHEKTLKGLFKERKEIMQEKQKEHFGVPLIDYVEQFHKSYHSRVQAGLDQLGSISQSATDHKTIDKLKNSYFHCLGLN